MTQEAKIRISAEAAQALAELRKLRDAFTTTGAIGKKVLDESSAVGATQRLTAVSSAVKELGNQLAAVKPASDALNAGLANSAARQNIKGTASDVKGLGDEIKSTQRKAETLAEIMRRVREGRANTAPTKPLEEVREGAEKAKTGVERLEGALKLGAAYLALKETVGVLREVGGAILDARIQSERMASGALFAADGRMDKALQELGYIKRVANELGLELASTAEQFFKLSAASKGTSLEGEPTRRIFEGIAKAATVLSLSVDETAGALNAIQQMISKGTVSAEELRGQLGERLPGAFQIAARAMGVTTEELGKMLEQGEIASTDLLPKLANQLEKEFGGAAERASQNTQQALNRVGTAWVQLKQAFADSGPADALRGVLDGLAASFTRVADGIAEAKRQGKGFFGQMLGGLRGGVGSKSYADLQKEQAQLQATVNDLKKKGGEFSLAGAELPMYQRQLDDVQVEIARRQRAAFDQDVQDRKSGSKNPSDENANKEKLGAARTALKALIEGAKTDQQKLADERAKFMEKYKGLLSAPELAAAEESFAKREAKLNTSRGTARAARAVLARKGYDQELDLQADAVRRESQLNEQQFSDGIKGFAAYFADRRALLEQATDFEVQQLQQRLAAEQAGLAAAQRGGDAAAVVRQQEAIARIEADITKKRRDQVDAVAQIKQQEDQVLAKLREQNREIDQMLRRSTGADTAETVAADVRARYERELQSVMANDQNPEPLLKLIDVEVERAKFELLVRQFEETRDQLRQRETALQNNVALGLMSQSDAERQILQLRKDSADQLERQSRAISDQSAKLNEVAGKTQPKEAGQAEDVKQEKRVLTDTRTDFEKLSKSSAISGFKTLFKDIATGANTAGEALQNMVAGFLSSMLDALAQNLAEQLVGQFTDAAGGAGGASGGGGGFMDFIGSLFHTGGVVGMGSGATRALPASTWQMAPRYHTGGLAGLMPGEQPSILKVGEEVLRRDDPRHVLNGGRSAGGMSVSNQVVFNNDGGDREQQRSTANDLLSTINTAIETWAARNSRPGGVLAKGRS